MRLPVARFHRCYSRWRFLVQQLDECVP